MYGVPFEDEYWEHVRERYDAEFLKQPGGEDDEVEVDAVYLDEEYPDLEREFGKPMDRFTEDELFAVLARFTKGLEFIWAEWSEASCGINYTYSAA